MLCMERVKDRILKLKAMAYKRRQFMKRLRGINTQSRRNKSRFGRVMRRANRFKKRRR